MTDLDTEWARRSSRARAREVDKDLMMGRGQSQRKDGEFIKSRKVALLPAELQTSFVLATHHIHRIRNHTAIASSEYSVEEDTAAWPMHSDREQLSK